MRKLLFLPLLSGALLLHLNGYAQKSASKAHAPVKKSTTVQPAKSKAAVQGEMPPEVEVLEATKIDALPVFAFDSTVAPDDALTQEIKWMLDNSKAVDVGIATAENLLQQQKAANTDAKMDEFYTRFLKEMKSERFRGLFENIFVKIYRDHYNLQEIKELNEFYKTPAGKKMIQVMPLITQQSQTEGGKLGQVMAMQIYQQMMQEEAKK